MFESFDWTAIAASLSVLVNGIPLVLVVIGLVYAAGEKFGVSGKWQFLLSLGIGLIFGGGYQLASVGPVVDFAGWFGIVVYGLSMGLLASMLYDSAKDLLSKIVEKLLGFSDQGVG
ncbi:MAG: hypothetical protein U9R53_10935 [Chloroflexota bacterium]|nr:hypothetical protein [Chloroflexota bacterium]